jgi:hypothetical protein
MTSGPGYVLKKTLLTAAQAEVLVQALKEYEESEMDHGSPVNGDVALTVRRKIKKNLGGFDLSTVTT